MRVNAESAMEISDIQKIHMFPETNWFLYSNADKSQSSAQRCTKAQVYQTERDREKETQREGEVEKNGSTSCLVWIVIEASVKRDENVRK